MLIALSHYRCPLQILSYHVGLLSCVTTTKSRNMSYYCVLCAIHILFYPLPSYTHVVSPVEVSRFDLTRCIMSRDRQRAVREKATACSRRSQGTSPRHACPGAGSTTICARPVDVLGPTDIKQRQHTHSEASKEGSHAYRALAQRQVKRMTGKLLLQVRDRRNRLRDWVSTTNRARATSSTRTPPSRIRNGSTPHSSLTALSSAWNHGSSRLPSHQSAVWSIVTCRKHTSKSATAEKHGVRTRTFKVFGERMRSNSFLKCSCTAAAISSNAWSGTIRTEICARTFDGITVESAPSRHKGQRHLIATRRRGERTARPGNLDVVDRKRGLAPARGEQQRRGLRHAREHLVQLPLVLRERTHAIVCEDLSVLVSRRNETCATYRSRGSQRGYSRLSVCRVA